jgi:hypothetical protein
VDLHKLSFGVGNSTSGRYLTKHSNTPNKKQQDQQQMAEQQPRGEGEQASSFSSFPPNQSQLSEKGALGSPVVPLSPGARRLARRGSSINRGGSATIGGQHISKAMMNSLAKSAAMKVDKRGSIVAGSDRRKSSLRSSLKSSLRQSGMFSFVENVTESGKPKTNSKERSLKEQRRHAKTMEKLFKSVAANADLSADGAGDGGKDGSLSEAGSASPSKKKKRRKKRKKERTMSGRLLSFTSFSTDDSSAAAGSTLLKPTLKSDVNISGGDPNSDFDDEDDEEDDDEEDEDKLMEEPILLSQGGCCWRSCLRSCYGPLALFCEEIVVRVVCVREKVLIKCQVRYT